MALPEVVAHEQWLAARNRLLSAEKEETRRRDALSAINLASNVVNLTPGWPHNPDAAS